MVNFIRIKDSSVELLGDLSLQPGANLVEMTTNTNLRLKYIILLAAATPGIPEYLTGSWKLSLLFTQPVNFLAFLALNLGLYTTGALLVREFAVAFRKGWVSVFVMGCAYGIMEEAIALHTFFQVSGSPVGFLGTYGRFAGVDWVWAFGLAVFHAIFSITIPILLISLAYPDLSNRRIFGKTGVASTIVIYVTSVLILNYLVNHTSTRPVPTHFDYLFSILTASILVIVSYFIPRGFMIFRGKEGKGSMKLYILGLLIYPVYNIFAFVPVNPEIVTRISPFIDVLIHLVMFAGIAVAIIHYIPERNNGRQKFSLAAGALTSLMFVSMTYEINRTAPFIAIFVIIAALLLYNLGRKVNIEGINKVLAATQSE